MKLHPDLEAKILATPGVVVYGQTSAESAEPPKKPREKPALLEAEFIRPATWIIPLETHAEANGRSWKARSARTQAARRAVSQALGKRLVPLAFASEGYHFGRPVKVRLTRLGGRALDPTVNLPSALKAVEDAVCMMIGADDGSPLWQCRCDQEPGGAYGVRITFETEERPGTITEKLQAVWDAGLSDLERATPSSAFDYLDP